MARKEPLIIAGPCAAESERQVMSAAEQLAKLGITVIRLSLHKPRTGPGFDGVHDAGIPWLAKVTQELGLTVATEVLSVKDAIDLLAVFEINPQANVWPWLGSRNQNHQIQQGVARLVKDRYPRTTKVLLKNQPWPDEDHWQGIARHAQIGGLSPQQILLCHRGFHANGNNPRGWRNVPDHQMAMNVATTLQLPMLFDASHVGGRPEAVIAAAKEAKAYAYAGYMIEVHPDPTNALTDARQQLTVEQFAHDLLPFIQ
jgi:chorismate mutase